MKNNLLWCLVSFSTLLFLPACSSPQAPASGSAGELNRFSSQPSLVKTEIQMDPDEPLADAFERVRQSYHRENIRTFDARRAYATSAAADFAWYFTINDPSDPFGRTNHVFFVVTSEWTDETTRSFLLSYLVMPGAPIDGSGRSWFHFYSAHPVPLAVRFMFSNTQSGALEAALLSELGAGGWAADSIHVIGPRVEAILERLDLATPEQLAATCPQVLDDIYRALPPPGSSQPSGVFGSDYVPEGTLAAIGLLVGDSIRTALPGAVHWEEDDASEVYPRLRVTDVTEGILRPIGMMIEFYAAQADVLPTTYCNRMVENLMVDSPNLQGE